MPKKLNIAMFGSSLVSAYWNGTATYYRGIIRALHARGHHVTFYEPDIFGRQRHRDIFDPPWARVVVYSAQNADNLYLALLDARNADIIVKASHIGVFDELLESLLVGIQKPGTSIVFWDIDAPATLDRLQHDALDPFHSLIPHYDLILTYGGGAPVVQAYAALGARQCIPIYNALDPHTHHPATSDARFEGDLGFLGHRRPDREARIDEFFFHAAARLPHYTFLLGGNGWEDKPMSPNVLDFGYVYTYDHNAFNCTPRAILNINRASTTRYGFTPSTRIFEAAGAGACLISDDWPGMDLFLEPGHEVLIARNGAEVADHLQQLTPERARMIGDAAFRRVVAEHTYTHRAAQLEAILGVQSAKVMEVGA